MGHKAQRLVLIELSSRNEKNMIFFLLFYYWDVNYKNIQARDHLITCFGGAVVSTVASKEEGCGFDSSPGPFCVQFACSSCDDVGFLRLPPTFQRH